MRVAVVGGGISGLSAANVLQQFADTTLFEAKPRLGGHTDTHNVFTGVHSCAVDTGFIVFNRPNYPLFSAWLDRLGITTQPSDMSFAVRRPDTGLEYGTDSLGALFCQQRNARSVRFLSMLNGIRRFYRRARLVADDDGRTLGEYVDDECYPVPFVDDHLLPLCSALWSAPVGGMRSLPVAHVVKFMANHCLLEFRNRPVWRVVSGGSHSYVDAFRRHFRGRLHLGQAARHIDRLSNSVRVVTDRGSASFDRVVLACHADDALALIEPSPAERDVLGAFAYQDNVAVLHSDESAMPRDRRAWSSWNVTADDRDGTTACNVTYWMNRLQRLPGSRQFFVSLNPRTPPHHAWVERDYRHPVFTTASQMARSRRTEIDGRNRIHYCGAYWGWGFHEDGFRSGVEAATAIRDSTRV
ncbi:MAG: FAD-dependent oxidoreductase [Gammaproteobacteria bacterium]|nr:FAD-dependent oxidoreductase [Gammaproteobacteria bacterium]